MAHRLALYNQLEGAVLTSSDEDALFPKANLILRPSEYFRFNSVTNPSTISADFRYGGAAAGDFTAWSGGFPVGWTVSGGAPDQVSPGRGGAGSALGLDVGLLAIKDYTVRSGSYQKFDGWIAGTGGASVASVTIQNLETGYTLQAGGTWTNSVVLLATEAGTSYAQKTQEFQVQSFADCGYRDTVTLRIILWGPASLQANYDDIYLYPAHDFVGVHGHNLDKQVAAELQYSDDGSSWSAHSTFTRRGQEFFASFTRAYRAHWRLRFNGTSANTARIYIGTAFFAQQFNPSAYPGFPLEIPLREHQIRSGSPSGEQRVAALGLHPTRSAVLRYRTGTADEWEDLRDEIYARTRGGLTACVVVPDDEVAPEVCLYGWLESDLDDARKAWLTRDAELTLMGAPMPVVVA